MTRKPLLLNLKKINILLNIFHTHIIKDKLYKFKGENKKPLRCYKITTRRTRLEELLNKNKQTKIAFTAISSAAKSRPCEAMESSE